MDEEQAFSFLPKTLAEIAVAAGLEAAMAMVATYGGTVVFIPGTVDENSKISKVVGLEAAQKIVAHFASDSGLRGGRSGVHLTLPKGAPVLTEERVREVFRKAFSANAAARELDVHIRTVYRWRKKIRQIDAEERRKKAERKSQIG